MNLYLDIETLPSNDLVIIAEIEAAIKPPGVMSKAETIAKWEIEENPKAIKDALSKTSFDSIRGSIACIAWAFDDKPVQVVGVDVSITESQMLNDFYESVREFVRVEYHGGQTTSGLTVVGHNVAGFDLPFLKHRSIIHGIKPQQDIRKAMNAKPWDSCIADTMLMWSSDREKRVSMDKLCKAFGIAGKGDFDGSMVADTWPVDPIKVMEYCKDDVERTRHIYKRLTFSEAA